MDINGDDEDDMGCLLMLQTAATVRQITTERLKLSERDVEVWSQRWIFSRLGAGFELNSSLIGDTKSLAPCLLYVLDGMRGGTWMTTYAYTSHITIFSLKFLLVLGFSGLTYVELITSGLKWSRTDPSSC